MWDNELMMQSGRIGVNIAAREYCAPRTLKAFKLKGEGLWVGFKQRHSNLTLYTSDALSYSTADSMHLTKKVLPINSIYLKKLWQTII